MKTKMRSLERAFRVAVDSKTGLKVQIPFQEELEQLWGAKSGYKHKFVTPIISQEHTDSKEVDDPLVSSDLEQDSIDNVQLSNTRPTSNSFAIINTFIYRIKYFDIS